MNHSLHYLPCLTLFAVDAESVLDEVQMDILDLQCDTILKQFLSRDKYPKLVSAAAEIMAMFGSLYVCGQFFSSMKINKFALQSRLTDEHLYATLISSLMSILWFLPNTAISAVRVCRRRRKSEFLNYTVTVTIL